MSKKILVSLKVFGRNFALAIHEHHETLFTLVLHHKGFNDQVLIQGKRLGGFCGTAVFKMVACVDTECNLVAFKPFCCGCFQHMSHDSEFRSKFNQYS